MKKSFKEQSAGPGAFGRSSPSLHTIDKSSPDNPNTTAVYRIAYGANFFYLYIEADGDKLNYRDRGF